MRRFTYTARNENEATPAELANGIVFRHGPITVTKVNGTWTVDGRGDRFPSATKSLALFEADHRADEWNERTGAV